MSETKWKWTRGGWREAKGKIVAHPDPPNGPLETICKMETGTADSALIAAAPELAEALENLISATLSISAEHWRANKEYDAARAALKKARGES